MKAQQARHFQAPLGHFALVKQDIEKNERKLFRICLITIVRKFYFIFCLGGRGEIPYAPIPETAFFHHLFNTSKTSGSKMFCLVTKLFV